MPRPNDNGDSGRRMPPGTHEYRIHLPGQPPSCYATEHEAQTAKTQHGRSGRHVTIYRYRWSGFGWSNDGQVDASVDEYIAPVAEQTARMRALSKIMDDPSLATTQPRLFSSDGADIDRDKERGDDIYKRVLELAEEELHAH